MTRFASLIAVVTTAIFLAGISGIAPAAAVPALAALPIGKSATFHLTTQSDKPPAGGGASSTSNTIHFVRASATAFNVSVDGLQAGQIVLDQNGAPIVPSSLKKLLAPFSLVALLMSDAPHPAMQNSSWDVNVPIPLDGKTNNLPAIANLVSFSANGGTVTASGQTATDVRPMLREKPTTIAFNATLNFNGAMMLSSANSTVDVAINAGRLRTQHARSSWTLTLTGP
jgi:hypothetical protein